MRTYLLMSFIAGCLGVLSRGVFMLGEHPRHSTHSIGEDTLGVMLNIALIAWAAFLLWGNE
jgi:hypothetical protein